jgi:transcriptional regulator with XRE-family HTH domain
MIGPCYHTQGLNKSIKIMEKTLFASSFSSRLKASLLNAGLISSRSTSGVDIHELVAITGYSSQICRKYLKGQAIPEPSKLCEIAAKLNVSPGWLLFGESATEEHGLEKILLSKATLHYLFYKAHAFAHQEISAPEFANFLSKLSYDISEMEVNDKQSMKIIDLTFNSLLHKNQNSNDHENSSFEK